MVKLIKLFEIQPAYNGLVDTWDAIAGKLHGNENLLESSLMKSISKKSNIGYINISQWKSIEAFRGSMSMDIVLKYHFMGNGQSKNEVSPHLYKSIITKGSFAIQENDQLIQLFLMNHGQLHLSEITDFWQNMTERHNKNFSFVSSELFKSLYAGSKYRYLFTINRPVSGFVNNKLDEDFIVKTLCSEYSYIGTYREIESIRHKFSGGCPQ